MVKSILVGNICAKARAQDSVKTHSACYNENVYVKQGPISAIKSKYNNKFRSRSVVVKDNVVKKKCYACGLYYPHDGECPPKGKKCRTFNVEGHFAKSKLCKSGKTGHLKTIFAEGNNGKVQTDDNAQEKRYLLANYSRGGERPTVKIEMDNQLVDVLIDSGASENVIDENTFSCLKKKPKLQTSSCKLYSYNIQRALEVLGEFSCRVSYDSRSLNANFKVIEGSAGNLLSFNTSRDLNLFRLPQFHCKQE